jgi:hypothetical protein
MANESEKNLAADVSRLVDQLRGLNLSPEDLNQLEKASAVAQSSAQIDKLHAEAQKLEVEKANLLRGVRSEHIRFWIPIIAPFISAIAVIATLLFQMHQFNENSRLTRQTDEGVQFRAAIQSAHLPAGLDAYASQAILTSFLNSETYGAQARAVAISMMAGIGSREGFRNLFYSVFPTITYSNVPELARLSRMVNELLSVVVTDKKRAEEGLANAKKSTSLPGASVLAVRSAQEQVDHLQSTTEAMQDQAAMIAKSIATALRQKPSDIQADLSDILFWNADLSGISFGKASLKRADVQNCDVTNADLSEVSDFADSTWSYTAWWRAAKLNPALAQYLKANFPFAASTNYFGQAATQAEYDQALIRFTLKS